MRGPARLARHIRSRARARGDHPGLLLASSCRVSSLLRHGQGRLAGGRCPCSGHERRRAAASRVRSAEFQGFPPGLSVVEPPMSAVWTPRCSRIAGRRWTPTVHVLRSATARGPGCTGQGLCILHETPPTVEYTHIPASSTHTSCSTRQVPPERPSPPPSGDAIKRPRRPGKSAHRWLRCHDTRPPQKPRDNTLAGLIARTHESSAARATPTSGTSAMPTTPRAKSRRS
mgnify:CR=1 FL=1